jgi:uncharacterized membrane protein (UPF0127 family)
MPRCLQKANRAALAALVILSFFTFAGANGDQLFRHANVVIQTDAGPARLDVEVADNERTREQGLMFRRELGAGQGMIFLFGTEQEITMWMKNTYISLDMVFIGDDWRIVHIAKNAEPFSTDVISSIRPASRVIEIAAGQADKLGLKAGDKVSLNE